ncbi:MAG: YlbF family regulator [Clostridiales bacterium]|jgi:hypothetical protein|nr:YlbF family regulator [Clostridiales bacterium]HOC09055.1 YlbF family regulator [Bacillota bacterium]HQA47217.1 YlbF family regulator [Bacillota bacterium]HQD41472.1 YlbF family regulator [Bacillota bacterium]
MKRQRAEFELAVQLGKCLAQSEELTRLRKAQAELELDKEAARLYRELKEGRLDAGDKTVMEKPAAAELLSAEIEFNRLLKTINGIIGFYITGEENIVLHGKGCSGCRGCRA